MLFRSMNSRQCFYIADDRLVSIKTDYRDETLCIDTGVLPSDIHAFKKLLDTNGYKVGEEDKLEESFIWLPTMKKLVRSNIIA